MSGRGSFGFPSAVLESFGVMEPRFAPFPALC
jgi:hypothetical protein